MPCKGYASPPLQGFFIKDIMFRVKKATDLKRKLNPIYRVEFIYFPFIIGKGSPTRLSFIRGVFHTTLHPSNNRLLSNAMFSWIKYKYPSTLYDTIPPLWAVTGWKHVATIGDEIWKNYLVEAPIDTKRFYRIYDGMTSR